jgi:hypothetical protein
MYKDSVVGNNLYVSAMVYSEPFTLSNWLEWLKSIDVKQSQVPE